MIKRRHLVGCVVATIIITAIVNETRARADDGKQATTAIALTYEATPARACPKANGFRESVERRAPKARVTLASGNGKNHGEGGGAAGQNIRARIELQAREGHEARAKVTVFASDRIVAEREVSGRSCTEIAEASALLVAMFAADRDRDHDHDRDEPADTSAPPQDDATTATPPSTPPVVTTTAPALIKKAESATPVTPAKDVRPKHLVIAANPLALAVSRYSMQVEYLPTTHHAITLNPYVVQVKRNYTEDGQAYSLGTQNGVGSELGYRYYTGVRGPNGFFFGPSVILGSYWATSGTAPADALALSKPESYTAYGAALDLGGQAVIGPGIIFGAGAGVQYVMTSKETGISSFFEGRSGLAPRLLLSLGYGF